MAKIPKGLKAYMLESVPNFQKRSNCRLRLDWKTSCPPLGLEQMLEVRHGGRTSTSAVTGVTVQPLLQLSHLGLTELLQHRTHFHLPKTLLTVTYNNACDDSRTQNTD